MSDFSNSDLLRITLEAAVPVWVERLKREPFADLLKRSGELAQIVGEKGDVMQYGSKKRGETAKAFNALAEALAILSFMPGGVKFCGTHYQNEHPDNVPKEP